MDVVVTENRELSSRLSGDDDDDGHELLTKSSATLLSNIAVHRSQCGGAVDVENRDTSTAARQECCSTLINSRQSDSAETEFSVANTVVSAEISAAVDTEKKCGTEDRNNCDQSVSALSTRLAACDTDAAHSSDAGEHGCTSRPRSLCSAKKSVCFPADDVDGSAGDGKCPESQESQRVSLLLRLFESKLFDMAIALPYLFNSKDPGVLAYLG